MEVYGDIVEGLRIFFFAKALIVIPPCLCGKVVKTKLCNRECSIAWSLLTLQA